MPARLRARRRRAADPRPARHRQDVHGLAHDRRAHQGREEGRRDGGEPRDDPERAERRLRACGRARSGGVSSACTGRSERRQPRSHPRRRQQRPLRAAVRGSGYSLLGGTAWLWARADFRASVDVLFIDEAGQMSLADVLAVSASARSLVLLGDPQQLEQPQQASHPEGAQASALEHLLGDAKTVAEDRGLFLKQTRRLHPDDLLLHCGDVLREPAELVPGPRAPRRDGAGGLGSG